MALSIIGAGFGRTGTLSLKVAIEMLGRGPCYHMAEVIEHPEHIELWDAVADGKPSWDRIFEGFAAAVDWPVCSFYQPLLGVYPDARVILTARDPDKWHKSVSDTIYPSSFRPPSEDAPDFIPAHRKMVRKIVWDGVFDGRFEDKSHAIAVYERHVAEVKSNVPAEKLLVFEPKEGWDPLCDFLGCPVPGEPFPRINTTQDFQTRFPS